MSHARVVLKPDTSGLFLWVCEPAMRRARDGFVASSAFEIPATSDPIGIRIRSGRDTAVAAVETASIRHGPLIAIDLERCDLVDEDTAVLVRCLALTGCNLRFLFLAGNRLGPTAIGRVVDALLEHCPNIQHVGVTANPLGPSGVAHVCRMIRSDRLTRLHATRVAWDSGLNAPGALAEEDWADIAAAVTSTTQLKVVFFKQNGTPPSGIRLCNKADVKVICL